MQRVTDAKTNTERAIIIENAKVDILGQITENKGEDISENQFKTILGKYFKEESIPDEIPDDLSTLELTTIDEKYTIIASELYDGTIKRLSPGLYYAGTDNLIMSWEELIKPTNRMIDVSESKELTRNYFNLSNFIDDDEKVKLVVDKSVTSVGSMSGISRLDEVKLPNTITNINARAFTGCSDLQSVTIPSGIIGDSAFYDLNKLKDVKLGNKVTSIGASASLQDSSLESIEIPSSVTSIGNFAFLQSGLKSVTIPSTVTTMGESIFNGCNKLETASLECSGKLTNGMFFRCTELKSVYIGENLKLPDGGIIFDGIECKKIKEAVILGIGDVGEKCFYENKNLTKVKLGKTVTNIGERAFQETDNLKKIDIKSKGVIR